eukprot:5779018-Amphidinium_carterae.5
MHIHSSPTTFVVTAHALTNLSVALEVIVLTGKTLRLAKKRHVVHIVLEVSLKGGQACRQTAYIPAETLEANAVVLSASRWVRSWEHKVGMLTKKSIVNVRTCTRRTSTCSRASSSMCATKINPKETPGRNSVIFLSLN